VLKIISQVIIQGNWVGHWKKLHHRKVSHFGFKNKQKVTKYQTGKPVDQQQEKLSINVSLIAAHETFTSRVSSQGI
jgi:hypothetical protein